MEEGPKSARAWLAEKSGAEEKGKGKGDKEKERKPHEHGRTLRGSVQQTNKDEGEAGDAIVVD